MPINYPEASSAPTSSGRAAYQGTWGGPPLAGVWTDIGAV